MKGLDPAPNSKAMAAILAKSPIVSVLTIEKLELAIPLAKALVRGGLPVIEVTLRTECAYEIIETLAKSVPGAVVGAGTVLGLDQLDRVKSLGAKFAVSPGITTDLLKRARRLGIPYLPGVTTASEIMVGMREGYGCFKFYPASSMGGLDTLKAFSAPFSDLVFCPTGGINPKNFRDYLASPNVIAVGGSWLASKELIDKEDWNTIEEQAKDTLGLLTKLL